MTVVISIPLFDPAHCEGAKAHPSHARYQYMLDDPGIFREHWPETYSAIDGIKLVAIGGTTWVDCRLGGWVVFTDAISPARFLAIHRIVARRLMWFEGINAPVFIHVDPANPQAMRWAGLLGLEMRRTEVFPDGRRMLRAENHVS